MRTRIFGETAKQIRVAQTYYNNNNNNTNNTTQTTSEVRYHRHTRSKLTWWLGKVAGKVGVDGASLQKVGLWKKRRPITNGG